MSKKESLLTVLRALQAVGEENLTDIIGAGREIDARHATNMLFMFADNCDDNLVRKPLSKKAALRMLVNFVDEVVGHNPSILAPFNEAIQDNVFESMETLRNHADACDDMLRID